MIEHIPLLAVIKQHLALGIGGILAIAAFPLIIRLLHGFVFKYVGELIVAILEAGDDHVDRLLAHALAVLDVEIPDHLEGNTRVGHVVDLLLGRFPNLVKHRARVEKLADSVLAALDERAKAGADNFKVVLMDPDGRTTIERKK